MRKETNKKGQSALEFVTLYGWSFFIVLIVMVGFIYFGLSVASDRIVDSCFASQGFICDGFELTEENQVVMIQSVFGSIDVVDAKVTHKQKSSDCIISSSKRGGDYFVVQCNESGFKEYSKVKLVVHFYYHDSKGVYEYPKEGIVRIIGTVIPSVLATSNSVSNDGAGEQGQNYDVSSCSQSFYSGNNYTLNSSVFVNSSCFNVNADNVILDCNNNSIIGDG